MKKLVITGAAGEAGFNLIQILQSEYHKTYEVVAIDKNENNCRLLGRLFPKITIVIADLAEKGEWFEEVKDAYAVVQLQAQISSIYPDAYERNNVESVKNILEACRKYKITRMIYASSSVVSTKSKDLYTITKRKGEEIVQKSSVPHISLRQTLMYGLFDIKHVGYLATFFDKGPIFPMPGSGKYLRQPIYVRDYCRIIINAIEMRMDNKVYDITGKEEVYLIHMLKMYAKAMKKRIAIVPIPLRMFKLLIKTYKIFDRNTRIVPAQLDALIAGDYFVVTDWDKHFNVKPTPLKEGISEMVSSKYFKYAKEMTRSNI
jgi:nucleoside-diphosphate-sugar epimerase